MPRTPVDPAEDEEEEGYRWRESVRKSGAKSRRRLFSPDRVPKEIIDKIRAMLDPEHPGSADLRSFPPNSVTCSLDDLTRLPNDPDLTPISYTTEPTPLLDPASESDEDCFYWERESSEGSLPEKNTAAAQRRLFQLGEGREGHDPLEGIEPLEEPQSRSSSPTFLEEESSDFDLSEEEGDVCDQRSSPILIVPPNSPVNYFEETLEVIPDMDSTPGSGTHSAIVDSFDAYLENQAIGFEDAVTLSIRELFSNQENLGPNAHIGQLLLETPCSGSSRKKAIKNSDPPKDPKPMRM